MLLSPILSLLNSLQYQNKMESGKQFDQTFLNAKYLLKDNPRYANLSQHEKQILLQKRVEKFFNVPQEIDVAEEFYKPRRDPEYGEHTTTSDDTIMVFGIDFLQPAELKNIFSACLSSGEKIRVIFLDKSNCLIYFPNPHLARQTLEHNAKKNSSTAFKIEEGAPVVKGQFHSKKLPKGWIELNEYIYRHQYDIVDQNIYKEQEYPRKWYARYATNDEKIRGEGPSLSRFKELYERARIIWTAIAENNRILRQIVERKLQQFQERLEEPNRQRQKLKRSDRSRSRNRPETKKTSTKPSRKSSVQNQLESLLNQESQQIVNEENIIDRSRKLIEQIEEISHQMESSSNDPELKDVVNKMEKLNFGSVGEFVDLPYKVAVPSQMRSAVDRTKPFTYQEYINKTAGLSHRMKSYVEIDLT